METKTLGRYIVADPTICHGEPTFRGTRIMIADMRGQVESGMDGVQLPKSFAWYVR